MADSDANRDRVLKAALNCQAELMAYARAMLGHYAAAEDAVQEAMLVVANKFDQFEEGSSMLAWCRSIVRIEVLRAKQRHQRERSLAARVLDDAIDAAFKEFQTARRREDAESRREALERCLQRVPEQGQGLLSARFVDELSYERIGERLGMRIEGVRKTLFRVSKQLRACVETSLRTTQ